ncbi:unnamed protein product [Parajaminaea phylloscopi]
MTVPASAESEEATRRREKSSSPATRDHKRVRLDAPSVTEKDGPEALCPTLPFEAGSPSSPSAERHENWQMPLSRQSPSHWAGQKAVPFQRPEQICTFSYDESRDLWHDDRSLKYFHVPPPGADLNRGFGSHVNKDESKNEHLDSLLFSLLELAKTPSNPQADQPRRRADVITWRGQATKLCTALYEEQYPGFEMNAMLVNGTLYIEEHLSAQARTDKNQRNTSADAKDQVGRKLTYHGSSFESWCTHDGSASFDYQRDDPWGGSVNTNVQWCSIVKTKLGPHRLILGGEVDCIDERSRRVELKMSMVLRNPRDVERFERKLLKFYMQSFLLGTERVLVGFRDKYRCALETTHEFATLEMPKAVRGKPHAWDQQACLNMASAILSFVREQVAKSEGVALGNPSDDTVRHAAPSDDDSSKSTRPAKAPAVYRISLAAPFESICITKLTSDEVREEVQSADDSIARVGFLPSEYYDYAITTPHIY